MNQEEYIKQTAGTEQPFSVPEGYFEQFAANLMAQLPEQPVAENEAKRDKVRGAKVLRARFLGAWRGAVAACLLALVVSGSWFFFNRNQSAQLSSLSSQNSAQPATVDDYVMMDNEAIYAYLSDY